MGKMERQEARGKRQKAKGGAVPLDRKPIPRWAWPALGAGRGSGDPPHKALCVGQAGQSMAEWAILYSAVIMPLTFAVIFTSELVWVWHSVAEMTREGARYAATHCWDGSGDNVMTYMRGKVPAMVDQQQFQNGEAEITVEYFTRNAETGTLEEFSCDQGECSTLCVPDLVRVGVTNYSFRRFLDSLGLPGVPLPDFRTTVPMESAGCDPEQATCVP